MKYNVTITEILKRVVIIEADNRYDAEEITEKVSIRIDESKATVFLNDEKETEAVETVIKAAERALNLNSKKQG